MTPIRLLERLGVDGAQWGALVRAYLRMDLRAGAQSGGAKRDRKWSGGLPYLFLLGVGAVGGGLVAFAAAWIPDPMAGAAIVTTYGAVNTAMLLLVEFTAFVISPTDYAVLGHRPISGRTYFVARLTSVLAYVTAVSLAVSVLPALTFALWRGFGAAAFLGMVAAVVLCNVACTVIVIATYTLVLTVVHPKRVRRATSTLQLVAASMFYGTFYLASSASPEMLAGLSFDRMPWMWANPAAWFAAWLPISAGHAGGAEWLAGASAVLLTMACVPLAVGRLSLDYARRIGELSAAGEPASRARPGVALGLPGFRDREGRAVALLVRAQFRYDTKFRLSVLGMLPLIAFYLLLGSDERALADPFVQGTGSRGAPLVMAIIFIPMTLHASLHVSESWRAAWIFFAAPASAARLVLATKNFAAVFFLGTYVLLLAALWSVFYERIWHAVVHATVLGLLAHGLLQAAVLVRPGLPFASEPRRAEASAELFGVFFVGGIAANLITVLLPVLYAHPLAAIVFFVLLVGGTLAMEAVLSRRLGAALDGLEFG